MKKSIFKILFVVAVLVGISIPNNVAAQQNVVDNDSLSIALGNFLGYYYKKDFSSNNYNKSDIIKGIEYTKNLNIDEDGYSVGFNIGNNIASFIKGLNNPDKIDKKIVAEEFKYALIFGVNDDDLKHYENYINNVTNSYNDSIVYDCDSISIALAKNFGGNLANGFETLPDSLSHKFTKTAIIYGVEHILDNDIYNNNYIDGLLVGSKSYNEINYLENLGADINIDLFYNELYNSLFSKDINDNKIQYYRNYIVNAIEKFELYKLENSPEAIANKKAGEEYIANLKKKDKKIKTTKSGLSYKIIEIGTGDKITDDDIVKVAYKGSLIDGTVFDDSNGEYREFPVSDVVPGFAEGLKLLNKGGKAILYIPGNLGYGVKGQPYAGIGPNEMLIFEVEIDNVTIISIVDDQNIDIIDVEEKSVMPPPPAPKPEPRKETNYDYDENKIFTVVEQRADYPGGDAALLQFINENIQYPDLAVEDNAQGRVTVSFIVEKDGSISDVKVVRGRHPELDKEAVRVVKKITKKFIPAKQNGKIVRYKFIIPVSFKLTSDDINTEEKK